MKTFTDAQVDDIILLKFGRPVTELQNRSFVRDSTLGKLFKCSASKIRQLYMSRLEKIRVSKLSLMERLQLAAKQEPRKNYGMRFLKEHEIEWLTNSKTLKRQTAMSLVDRCRHFHKEFPNAKLNPTLLRQVYQRQGIKQKKLRWTKASKELDARAIR